MANYELERVIEEFCDAWGDGRVERPDVDRIVAMFAEDGEWFVSVPAGDRIKGRAAIRAEIERQLGFVSFMQCGTIKTVSADATVVNERLDHFVIGGTRVAHALMAISSLMRTGRFYRGANISTPPIWRARSETCRSDRLFPTVLRSRVPRSGAVTNCLVAIRRRYRGRIARWLAASPRAARQIGNTP